MNFNQIIKGSYAINESFKIWLFSLDVPKERKTEFLAVEMGVYPLMDRLRRVYRTLIKA